MENSLTDTELNKWAAQFCRVVNQERDGRSQHVVPGYGTYQKWNPCGDEAQARIVLSIFCGEVGSPDIGRCLEPLFSDGDHSLVIVLVQEVMRKINEKNKLSDHELNKWAAEWLGVKTMHSNDERQHSYWIHNGVTHLRERWTPCTDRNQAQMVVEKATCEGLRKKYLEQILVPRTRRDLCDVSILAQAVADGILSSPRQLVEAAYEAVTSRQGPIW